MARKAKKSAEPHPHVVPAISFLCGLFAAGYGLYEGLINRSNVVVTTPGAGAIEMNPLVGIIWIIAGLVGMGFAIWMWVTPAKP